MGWRSTNGFSFIANLERQATQPQRRYDEVHSVEDNDREGRQASSSAHSDRFDDTEHQSELDDADPGAASAAAAATLENPLAPGNTPGYTTDIHGRPCE